MAIRQMEPQGPPTVQITSLAGPAGSEPESTDDHDVEQHKMMPESGDRSLSQHLSTLHRMFSVNTLPFPPLVLIVGPCGAGKTRLLREFARQTGYPLYLLGPDLSRRLLEVPPEHRAREVPVALREHIAAFRSDVLLVDRIELLFAPILRQDPLRLLRQMSRICSLVVAWPGSYQGDLLTYASPDHPEFRSYSHPGIPILSLGGEPDALPGPGPV
jgi:hypothetical protein